MRSLYSLINLRFIRFLAVGGLNTAVGYGLFALFIALGIHYSIAVALSTVLGVLFNFITTGRLVFQSKSADRLVRFVLVYLFMYPINVGALGLLMKWGLSAYLGGALLILPMAILGYILNAYFVFRTS